MAQELLKIQSAALRQLVAVNEARLGGVSAGFRLPHAECWSLLQKHCDTCMCVYIYICIIMHAHVISIYIYIYVSMYICMHIQ